MAIQHLKEGLDPTGLACISVSQLLQMIRNAQPYPDQGMIIWKTLAPDVVTNPELADFLWGYQVDEADDNTRTNRIYYYNGTSWELIPLELLDGSVTLPKIDISGANLFDILQVVAGPTLVWTDIVSAIQNNTVPPGKLLLPNNTDTFILSGFAGVQAFTELVAFFAAIVNNVIPVTKLIKGGADALKLWLSTKADGSAIEWSEIDLANLAASGFSAGQAPRRNGAGTGWEPFTPSAFAIKVLDNAGAYYALPAFGSAISIAHGLTTKPAFLRVVLRCVTATDGYGVDDELNIECVTTDQDGTNQYVCYGLACDDINIVVTSIAYIGGGAVNYQAKTGGLAAFDSAKWKAKAYVA